MHCTCCTVHVVQCMLYSACHTCLYTWHGVHSGGICFLYWCLLIFWCTEILLKILNCILEIIKTQIVDCSTVSISTSVSSRGLFVYFRSAFVTATASLALSCLSDDVLSLFLLCVSFDAMSAYAGEALR